MKKNMLEKQKGISATLNALEKSKEEKKPYAVVFFGKKFIVLPGVFSPKYFDDAKFFGYHLPIIVERKSLLEVGLGTGILSVLCALNGAKVSGVDLNPTALENTKQNAKLHKCFIDARAGDLFSLFKAEEKFDFIFWNHPFGWVSKEPTDILEKAVFDKGYRSLKRFFEGAKKHLLPNGKVLLGTSSLASITEIKKLAKKAGYGIKLLAKSEKEFVESKIPIDLRIYELLPIAIPKKC